MLKSQIRPKALYVFTIFAFITLVAYAALPGLLLSKFPPPNDSWANADINSQRYDLASSFTFLCLFITIIITYLFRLFDTKTDYKNSRLLSMGPTAKALALSALIIIPTIIFYYLMPNFTEAGNLALMSKKADYLQKPLLVALFAIGFKSSLKPKNEKS